MVRVVMRKLAFDDEGRPLPEPRSAVVKAARRSGSTDTARWSWDKRMIHPFELAYAGEATLNAIDEGEVTVKPGKGNSAAPTAAAAAAPSLSMPRMPPGREMAIRTAADSPTKKRRKRKSTHDDDEANEHENAAPVEERMEIDTDQDDANPAPRSSKKRRFTAAAADGASDSASAVDVSDDVMREPRRSSANRNPIYHPSDFLHVPRSQLTVGDRIGGGTFGQVHRALWQQTAVMRPVAVAVKMLNASNADDLRRQFELECAHLHALRGPLVIALLGVSIDESTPLTFQRYWIILELMEHGSLANYLQRANQLTASITFQQRLNWCRQCVEAIAFLHQRQAPSLHRDTKPANFLMDGQLNIKVGQSTLCDTKPDSTLAELAVELLALS
jgi:hypothetical protein